MHSVSSRLRSWLPVFALAFAGLAGCDEPAEFAGDEPVSLRPGGGYGCTQCSVNSPTVNDALITELNLDGVANSSGVTFVDIFNPANGLHYKPDMNPARDELIARNMNNPQQVVYTGPQLVGKVLSLMTPNGPVQLRIVGFDGQVPSWAAGGGFVNAYRMQYNDVDNVSQPVCPNTSDEHKDLVTLIHGETYDRETNEITPAQGRWFTIACVAEGAYKMKMMDYAPSGLRRANLEQRKATLRMVTADYCGDGTPYTVDGTPVAWRNANGSITPGVAETSLEAKWGPNGALCLDDPRYADPASIHCQIPACDGDGAFGPGIEWRTMLP
ncbi:ADYC domain-containing protein [Nannocystis sp. SCPEA4]|uniref:ADYC domain-containing protein n=1 Tax=Nannocystis sp. SCPEA4 TaxID=2996787 RepID=UPI0022704C1D|nr:ADYC domain-containing protein [Nannocystis sp. SCPEA4]MCY1054008.1 ADYC domain-containing protein [Nannocystis sp. SCPEA4]